MYGELQVTEYINNATEEQIEILEMIRNLIHQSIDGVSEKIKWGFPVFSKSRDFAFMRNTTEHIILVLHNIDGMESTNFVLEEGDIFKTFRFKNIEEVKPKILFECLKRITR